MKRSYKIMDGIALSFDVDVAISRELRDLSNSTVGNGSFFTYTVASPRDAHMALAYLRRLSATFGGVYRGYSVVWDVVCGGKSRSYKTRCSSIRVNYTQVDTGPYGPQSSLVFLVGTYGESNGVSNAVVFEVPLKRFSGLSLNKYSATDFLMKVWDGATENMCRFPGVVMAYVAWATDMLFLEGSVRERPPLDMHVADIVIGSRQYVPGMPSYNFTGKNMCDVCASDVIYFPKHYANRMVREFSLASALMRDGGITMDGCEVLISEVDVCRASGATLSSMCSAEVVINKDTHQSMQVYCKEKTDPIFKSISAGLYALSALIEKSEDDVRVHVPWVHNLKLLDSGPILNTINSSFGFHPRSPLWYHTCEFWTTARINFGCLLMDVLCVYSVNQSTQTLLHGRHGAMVTEGVVPDDVHDVFAGSEDVDRAITYALTGVVCEGGIPLWARDLENDPLIMNAVESLKLAALRCRHVRCPITGFMHTCRSSVEERNNVSVMRKVLLDYIRKARNAILMLCAGDLAMRTDLPLRIAFVYKDDIMFHFRSGTEKELFLCVLQVVHRRVVEMVRTCRATITTYVAKK